MKRFLQFLYEFINNRINGRGTTDPNISNSEVPSNLPEHSVNQSDNLKKAFDKEDDKDLDYAFFIRCFIKYVIKGHENERNIQIDEIIQGLVSKNNVFENAANTIKRLVGKTSTPLSERAYEIYDKVCAIAQEQSIDEYVINKGFFTSEKGIVSFDSLEWLKIEKKCESNEHLLPATNILVQYGDLLDGEVKKITCHFPNSQNEIDDLQKKHKSNLFRLRDLVNKGLKEINWGKRDTRRKSSSKIINDSRKKFGKSNVAKEIINEIRRLENIHALHYFVEQVIKYAKLKPDTEQRLRDMQMKSLVCFGEMGERLETTHGNVTNICGITFREILKEISEPSLQRKLHNEAFEPGNCSNARLYADLLFAYVRGYLDKYCNDKITLDWDAKENLQNLSKDEKKQLIDNAGKEPISDMAMPPFFAKHPYNTRDKGNIDENAKLPVEYNNDGSVTFHYIPQFEIDSKYHDCILLSNGSVIKKYEDEGAYQVTAGHFTKEDLGDSYQESNIHLKNFISKNVNILNEKPVFPQGIIIINGGAYIKIEDSSNFQAGRMFKDGYMGVKIDGKFLYDHDISYSYPDFTLTQQNGAIFVRIAEYEPLKEYPDYSILQMNGSVTKTIVKAQGWNVEKSGVYLPQRGLSLKFNSDGTVTETLALAVTVSNKSDTTFGKDYNWFKDHIEELGYSVGTSAKYTCLTAKSRNSWKEYDHPNIDVQPPNVKHILYQNENIVMTGYTKVAYKDFLLADGSDESFQLFTFEIERDGNDWHSIEGGGFIFNAKVTSNTISGYYILVTDSGLKIFESDSLDLTAFRNGTVNGNQISNIAISDPSSNHKIRILTGRQKISLWDGEEQLINSYDLPNEYGFDFGPITVHNSHSCEQRSFFTFTNIEMQMLILPTNYEYPLVKNK